MRKTLKHLDINEKLSKLPILKQHFFLENIAPAVRAVGQTPAKYSHYYLG